MNLLVSGIQPKINDSNNFSGRINSPLIHHKYHLELYRTRGLSSMGAKVLESKQQ